MLQLSQIGGTDLDNTMGSPWRLKSLVQQAHLTSFHMFLQKQIPSMFFLKQQQQLN